jgi:hypothetical protein
MAAADPLRFMVDPPKSAYVPGSMFQLENELGKSIKMLEARQWDAPEDASLFRKLARARFRLWHLNLDQVLCRRGAAACCGAELGVRRPRACV